MKMHAPAAQRNIGPIGDVLERWLPACGTVLELASGSGEHGLAFSQRFPALIWQPSDPDASARASIAAWQDERDQLGQGRGSGNFLPPLALDAASTDWAFTRADGAALTNISSDHYDTQLLAVYDACLCINMVHISAWAATIGLFRGCATLLPMGAPLILYGPYRESGVETAPSNLAFDRSLKQRNAEWGLRDLADVDRAAADFGFTRAARVEMPANNLMLMYHKA